VMPNALDIVIGFAAQARTSGRDTIFHVSGPDMVKYFRSEVERAGYLYGRLAELPSMKDVPAKLNVEIVPAASAVLANTTVRKAELEILETALAEFIAHEKKSDADRRAFFTGPNKADRLAGQELVDSINSKAATLRQQVSTAVSAIPEIVKGPRNPGFVTQYDVIEEGLIVSSLNMALTFNEL